VSGVNKLKNLKASKASKASKVKKEVSEEEPEVEAQKSEPKSESKKGFPHRQKNPEKEAEDNALKEAITASLGDSKNGLTATELREAIFESVGEDEVRDLERKIRSMCRNLGCTANKIEGSRRVRYTL